MRSLAFLCLFVAALAPERARAQVIWTQPFPMLFAGAPLKEALTHPSLRALSVGANIPVMGKAIVLETVITPGQHSGGDCGTTWFLGGWAAAGVLIPLGHSPTDGLFVEPKLIGSYFNQTSQGSGCVDATQVKWDSVEWDVGADVGFQFTLGPLYIAPVIGAFVGECYNCSQSTTVLAPYAPYLGQVGPRLSRISYGLNLNLLRIGLIF